MDEVWGEEGAANWIGKTKWGDAALMKQACPRWRYGLRSHLTDFNDVVFQCIMKTANVADLRNNFQQVAAWISEGETVAIHKRGKLFATLVPSTASVQPAMPEIDFAGRLKEIWGNKVFSAKEVAAMRKAEREGEEG